ncbi:hypothetical protein LWI29_010764 [Acer saccharum]|uniref:Uncharacterized protein n=1 Tax=Acer saccharum TaxID=4024 RepID=A0AA39RUF9_ACESA|nr:hypothetical protein LWI29_010764 [Acer saccharum]
MKYVKPCSLFYEMLKSAMELADKKPLGPQLLGLNLLEKHVTISISEPRLLLAIHYGVVERKRRNIHTIANLFRTLIPKYNLEGAVIGCPDIESTDNHEVAKVKSFVEDLCNTGKLEGLKYTYWDKRFAPREVVVAEEAASRWQRWSGGGYSLVCSGGTMEWWWLQQWKIWVVIGLLAVMGGGGEGLR